MEDILLLAMHFIKKYNHLYHKNIQGISETLSNFLLSHEWKGNVRELENTIERSVVFSKSQILEYSGGIASSTQDDAGIIHTYTHNLSLRKNLEKFERALIIDIFKKNKQNIPKTAAELKIGVKTLYRKLKKYGVKDEV